MEKQRIRVGSIGWLIERYIAAMNASGTARSIGTSKGYILRGIQRDALMGPLMARDLTHQQVKTWAKHRAETVSPATIMQGVCYLSGVLAYAGSEWDDCDGITKGNVVQRNT